MQKTLTRYEVFEGLADSLEGAIKKAHSQVPPREGKDFTISRAIEFGMQDRRTYRNAAILCKGHPGRAFSSKDGRMMWPVRPLARLGLRIISCAIAGILELAELVQKVQSGSITKEEAGTYTKPAAGSGIHDRLQQVDCRLPGHREQHPDRISSVRAGHLRLDRSPRVDIAAPPRRLGVLQIARLGRSFEPVCDA